MYGVIPRTQGISTIKMDRRTFVINNACRFLFATLATVDACDTSRAVCLDRLHPSPMSCTCKETGIRCNRSSHCIRAMLWMRAKNTTDSADFGNAITIVRDDDLSRQRVVCEDTQTNPCRKPILIVASPLQAPDVPKRNLSGLVNSALAALYKNNSKAAIQYFFKRSKGPSPVPQAEGVLEVNSHESDALAGIYEGFPVGD